MVLKFTIEEDNNIKKLISDEYNYVFNKNSKYFVRWGSTVEDDAPFSPFGPETVYIDIANKLTTNCHFNGNVTKPITPMPITTYMYVLELINTNMTIAQVVLGNITEQDTDVYYPAILFTKESNITPNTYSINHKVCEGALFNMYISSDAYAYPCPCCVGNVEGINLLEVTNFYKEVWCSNLFRAFRWNLLSNTNKCPLNKGENNGSGILYSQA